VECIEFLTIGHISLKISDLFIYVYIHLFIYLFIYLFMVLWGLGNASASRAICDYQAIIKPWKTCRILSLLFI